MKTNSVIVAILATAGILLTACPAGTGSGGNGGGGGLAAPSKVDAEGISSTRISLTWTAVSGAAKYRIYTSNTSTGVYRYVDETDERTYTVNDLVPNSTYYYKVTAIDISGMEGPQSIYAEGKTLTQTIAVPGSVRASAISPTSIQVTWNAVTDATSYKVYRSSTASGSYVLATTATITASPYTDLGLSPVTPYYYMVTAVTSRGESEQAGPASATTPAEGVVLSPGGLTAVPASYNSVQLNWNAVTEATGYRIYRGSAESGPFTLISAATATFHTDTGLSALTTYYYTVSTVHSGGESPQSGAISATTPAEPSVQPPAGLTATALDSGSIQVSWNAVSGATGYRVYRSDSANGIYTVLGSVSVLSYTDSGLSAGSTWYYKAASVKDSQESAQTATYASATTPAGSTIVTPPGATLTEQLAYIAANTGSGMTYDIEVDNNVTMGPATVSTRGQNVTVIIRSASPMNVRTIQLASPGHLFSVGTNVTLKLQDITLKGVTNNAALVLVGQLGKLILDAGAKITGNNNTSTQFGGGVNVDGGTLEINEGSEISGNSARKGAGIYVADYGTVTLRGGVISENIVNGSDGRGGGIYISGNSTATMTGGIISKNTVGHGFGGGIYIEDSGSSFTKTNAPGSNESGIIYGSTGVNANVSPYGGQVVGRNFGTNKFRNATLGYSDTFSSQYEIGWE